MQINEMVEELAQAKAIVDGWNWNDLPEKANTLLDGCPSRQGLRLAAKDVLKFLGSWGLGFYEKDDNFPANNRFISLSDILD